MFDLQNLKFCQLTPPIACATNATVGTVYADRLGYDEALIVVSLGTAGATNAPATLALQHASDTNATSFGSITGYVGGTDSTGGFTITTPQSTAASNNTQVAYAFHLDLRGKKRYLRAVVTSAGASQLVNAVAILGRAKQAPTGTTEQQVGVYVKPT